GDARRGASALEPLRAACARRSRAGRREHPRVSRVPRAVRPRAGDRPRALASVRRVDPASGVPTAVRPLAPPPRCARLNGSGGSKKYSRAMSIPRPPRRRPHRRTAMRGYITTGDLLIHPWTIVHSFGIRVYARCLVRTVTKRGRATFL